MYQKQPSLNGFRPFNALRGAGLKRIYDIVLRNDFAICIRYLLFVRLFYFETVHVKEFIPFMVQMHAL